MHDIVSFVFAAFYDFSVWTSDIATWFAAFAGHQPRQGEFAMAAAVSASLLVCVLGCAWALIERARGGRARYVASQALARAQSEIRFREAVIQSSPEAIVVMGADLPAPLSYRGGTALLQSCLGGPDSVALAEKMKGLLEGGAPFALSARTRVNTVVAVHGCVVGSRAAIFLRIEESSSELDRDLRAILEAMPVPIWIRDRALTLTWANRAFLAATGAGTLEKAMRSEVRLVRAERDLVSTALEGKDVLGERRYTVVEGRRRAMSVDMLRLPSAQVAGVAVDVTESALAEGQLKLSTDAYVDIMDRAVTGTAVFGADRRLVFASKPFARLSGLPQSFCDGHPTLEDVFDRLRELRRLPEQRDYQAWKKEHLRLFEGDNGRIDETWHIPGGKSLRVKAYPYLLGGVYYVFEDISETIRLKASLQVLAGTQRAALDTVAEAIAVFGPDGRLKMHNTAFADLWRLEESELADEPHLSRIAALSTARIGVDGIWSMVSSGITSGEPARYGNWGRVTRADGRVLSLSLTQLPLGAMLAGFEDITDIERFTAALGESSAA
ncbi:MAG TPA: PAS domain-containing protein [Rhizomicrobium sp.]